jgi:hypothetical protein
LFFCEICNQKADIHHIIHRHEGGLDIELNYKYLCEKHHRGKDGPHKNIEIDIKYKIELQEKLNKMLPKEYYSFKELMQILNISLNIMKRITKNMTVYKEGYNKNDIILYLMGGTYYSKDTLDSVLMEKLL